VVGPDLTPANVDLVQVAPGVYEAPLGDLEPGAYAVRVSQTLPGATPLGRTVGLVAPTAAEYRTLGANEPFLATLRSATGGAEVTTPLDPWQHDLQTTSRFTDLWPLLLVLALVLWPLDIALRRVSIGRREVVAARGWVGRLRQRRRATAPRTVTGAGLLAARERAGATEARAALRQPVASDAEAVADVTPAVPGAPAGAAAANAALAAPTAPVQAAPAPAGSPPMASPPAPDPAAAADTMARLREAKRRAREQR
jgi:hypothetical protein